MLKKSITYQTWDGVEVTEDFYFHLTKAELVEMELSHKGGLGESLKKIIASEDGAEIIKEFKNILLKSYGQKSDDGRRFIKNQQLRDEFESTEAYSVLFMELVTDADAAAAFVNGVIPQDLAGEAQMVLSSRTEESASAQVHPLNPQPRKLSQVEITEMDADELKSGLTSGRYEL